MKATEIKNRANSIITWSFKTELQTEKNWVNKQIKLHIDKYGIPHKFDMSEEACIYSLLSQAKKELYSI